VLVPEGRQILAGLTLHQNLELSRATGRLDPAAINGGWTRYWKFFRGFKNVFRQLADHSVTACSRRWLSGEP